MGAGKHIADSSNMRATAWTDQQKKVALTATVLLNLTIGVLSLPTLRGATDLGFKNSAPLHFSRTTQKLISQSQSAVQISGSISRSFFSDARAEQVPVAIIHEITEKLSQRYDFSRELRRGDRFTVKFAQTSPQETATLIYFTLTRSTETLLALYRTVASEALPRYLDQNGREFDSSFLRYPLKFRGITSKFSMARYHPVTGTVKPHYGVDFKAAHGTAVQAIADGIVTFAGAKGHAGLMIRIQHRSGYQSSYLHLSKISPSIKSGQRIIKGTTIGAVGSSGHATGPHLHFGLSKDGKHLDPLKYRN